MAQVAFPKHCLTYTTPSSSATYSYVHIRASASKPTILFLHGFPSSSFDWRHQIVYFSSKGYGVVAPDLLGYGGTDKPKSVAAYRGKKMATEVAEIIDYHSLAKVHCVGHDFGSDLLSRVVNYFPDRVLSCTFIAVPYQAPGGHFDLDVLKGITEKTLGFEKFGYMRFLSSDDSGDILDAHNESLSSLIYTSDLSEKMNFYPPGALQAWLAADRRAAQSKYITSAESETRNRIFTNAGYHGPTNWYRALIGNVNEEEEKMALADGLISPEISCPVLVIDAAPTKASPIGLMEMSMRAFARNLRCKTVLTEGHWVQIESREEVNAALEQFLREAVGE